MAPETFPHYHLFNCKTGLITRHSQKPWALGLGSLARTWPPVTGYSSLLCFYSPLVKFMLQPTERSSPGWLIWANCALSPGPLLLSIHLSVDKLLFLLENPALSIMSSMKPSQTFPHLDNVITSSLELPRHGGHHCTMTVLLHGHLSHWTIRSLGERTMFYTISNPGLMPNRCSVNSCRISSSPFPVLICV